jgi:hypothetical protein
MRTFRIVPTHPGENVHHQWMLVATTEDGGEVELGIFETVGQAEAAKLVLEHQDVQLPE